MLKQQSILLNSGFHASLQRLHPFVRIGFMDLGFARRQRSLSSANGSSDFAALLAGIGARQAGSPTARAQAGIVTPGESGTLAQSVSYQFANEHFASTGKNPVSSFNSSVASAILDRQHQL